MPASRRSRISGGGATSVSTPSSPALSCRLVTSARQSAQSLNSASVVRSRPDAGTKSPFTAVATRAPAQPSSLPVSVRGELRFEDVTEGPCIQTLHVGSFADEGPVLADLHDEWQSADNRRYLSEGSMALLYPDRDTGPIAAIDSGE